MSRKAIRFLRVKRLSEGAVLSWYKGSMSSDEEFEQEFSEFSIFRKKCDDFEFNTDYDEYFCDIALEDAELIYQGKLECFNNRKFYFADRNVKTGCTYAYFVCSKNMQAVGPVPVKIRDMEVWWPYEKLEQRIDALCSRYPEANKSICGQTVEGRDILSLKIGSGKPFLGLVGAVHPGEAGPELIISALERFLKLKQETLISRSIVVIPSVNIDMRERLVQGIPWYLRRNSAGVDLNRNFPVDWEVVSKAYGLSSDDRDSMTYRGEYPASEPETQSIINFFTDNTPSCIFSFHALAGICDLPALAAGGVDDSEESFYKLSKLYSDAYGCGLHPELEPEESWLSFGGTEGGMTRWCWHKLGIPCFDLELSQKIAPGVLKICRTDKTTSFLLHEYAEKHANAINKIMKITV